MQRHARRRTRRGQTQRRNADRLDQEGGQLDGVLADDGEEQRFDLLVAEPEAGERLEQPLRLGLALGRAAERQLPQHARHLELLDRLRCFAPIGFDPRAAAPGPG